MNLVLLDLDGVISPYERESKEDPWGDFQHFSFGFEMRFSKRMLDSIKSIDAKKIWLTTWGDQVLDLMETFSFPRLEVLNRNPNYQEHDWYKMDHVLNMAMQFEKIVWMDDQIKLEHISQLPNNVFCIVPKDHIGLTPSDIRLAKDWLK